MTPAIRDAGTLGQRHRVKRAGPARIGLVAAAVALAATNYALALRAERRNPPDDKCIQIDRVRLHYIDRGKGPPVILLHGNGTMARDFALSGLIDLLAKDHRVIAFDRPGFGHSNRPRTRIWTAEAQAALLWRALSEIAVHRPVIVGHSWGALVAIAMALRNPAETAGVSLLSGYYYPSVRRDVAAMLWPAIPVVGDVMRYTISPLLGRVMAPALFRTMFAPAPVSAQFERGFPVELAVRPWQIRAAAAEAGLMILQASRLARKYEALSLPVLILAGEQDNVVDFGRQSRRLAEELPNSTLRVFPEAGHMVHHTAPEQVANAIRELRQCSFATS